MSGIFVVIGSRKGTGLEVVKCLSDLPTSEVKEIRAGVRDVTTVPEELKQSRAKVVAADCTQPALLEQVLEGAQVVFICASGASALKNNYVDVDEIGPKNIAAIAKKKGVQRVVLVSSQLAHPSNFWNPIRIMLNTLVSGWAKKSLMDCKYAGEQYVRKSGVPYTIIRPGRLVDGPLGSIGKVVVGQTNAHFMSGKAMTRKDLAALCVAAGLSSQCENVTMECVCQKKEGNAPESGPESATTLDPSTLFQSLSSEWDKQHFLTTEQT